MNTTQPTRSPNEQFNFNLGYRRALRGVKYEPRLGAYKGYAEGWDAGNSDRPSLDDLTLDVASERRNPLGY
jgi:hypothetical protein